MAAALAAAIPTILESAPAVINAALTAKNIISKYAPAAKKVANLFFKSHSKSPSHLLSKLKEDPAGAINKVSEFVASPEAAEVFQDAQRLVGLAKTTAKQVRGVGKQSMTPSPNAGMSLTKKQLKQFEQFQALQKILGGKKAPMSYHQLLEMFK